MSAPFTITDTFITAQTPVTPRNAVAAIILDEEQRVLLQLRDDRDDIFFPNHWGCFGGAIEPGETAQDSLIRELEEEIGITFTPDAIRYFTFINFQPVQGAAQVVERHFFIVRASVAQLSTATLGEGSAMQRFTYEEAMRIPNATPYDKFGLWLYFNQARMRG